MSSVETKYSKFKKLVLPGWTLALFVMKIALHVKKRLKHVAKTCALEALS